RGASRAKQRLPGVNGGAQMAEAYVEERHLLKSLRWWDGFVIALCNPGFLIASLGFSMGALGYWIGWSVVLSIFGVVIGTLVQAQWFPNSTWSVYDGVVHLGLPQFLAIACIVAVWLLNVFGIRPAVWISYITGAGLLVPLGVFIVGPYITGTWHSSNM